MRHISGTFIDGHKVTLEVNGRVIQRRVRYTTCDGNYVVIGGERVRKDSFTK